MVTKPKNTAPSKSGKGSTKLKTVNYTIDVPPWTLIETRFIILIMFINVKFTKGKQ